MAHVLIVDDEAGIRRSLGVFLTNRGHRVWDAADVATALKLVDEYDIEVVVCDIVMKGMTGIDFIENLNNKHSSSRPKVIMLTGDPGVDTAAQAIRHGAFDYLTKPVPWKMVDKVVRDAAHLKKLEEENQAYRNQLEDMVRARTKELTEANRHLDQVNARLKKVVETTRLLASSEEAAVFGVKLLTELGNHMTATGGSLYLEEEDGLRLIHALDPGHAPAFLPFPLEEGTVFQRVLQSKSAMRIDDADKELDIRHDRSHVYKNGSSLIFPLKTESGRVSGLLSLHSKEDPPFVDQDMEIGEILISYSCERLRAIRAYAELEKSENKYRTLADQASDIVWIMDVSGKFTYVSPAVEELTGHLPQEILIRDLSEVLEADSAARILSFLAAQKALPPGQRAEGLIGEFQLICRDGSLVDVDVNSSWKLDSGSGDITGLQGIARDITERRKAARKLQEQQQFLQSIIDGIRDPLQVIDKDFRVLLANDKLLSQFGLKREDIGERTCFEAYAQSPDTCAHCSVKKVLETGQPLLEEREIPGSDGKKKHLEVSAYPLMFQDGQPSQVIELIRDVTEKKSLEEQLRVSQKLEAIGRLAGGVAHDFNNILSSIYLNTETALSQLPDGDPQKRAFSEISHAADSASDLVRRLLTFSRRRPMEPRVFQLDQLVERMHTMVRRLINESIALSIEGGKNACRVKADPGLVEQVLLNLVINARDAMPEGGRLDIKTSALELNEEECRHLPDLEPGSYAVLMVRDDGFGMSTEVCERIFEPFYTTKSKERGTGLGLSTAFGIVRQHGGTIVVDSQPDIGSCFSIYLPRAHIEKDAPAQEERPAVQHGTETILLVEDQTMLRNLTSRTLSLLGYEVLSAKSGQEALKLLEQHEDSIDLLFTDMVMPNMNGKALAQKVQSLVPGIKILFTSGYLPDLEDEAADDLEGANFIAKPLNPRSMSQAIRLALAGDTGSKVD